jgi:hypothetical protein
MCHAISNIALTLRINFVPGTALIGGMRTLNSFLQPGLAERRSRILWFSSDRFPGLFLVVVRYCHLGTFYSLSFRFVGCAGASLFGRLRWFALALEI